MTTAAVWLRVCTGHQDSGNQGQAACSVRYRM